jgi:signal transduction histidine kinase
MARAIHNLARNAIEAMADRGGKLGIDARMQDSELVILVSDTGPGIPKEIEGRLFQSFVTAGKEGGTGLGLAIVKKIVDEHGGRIEVRSDEHGATFEIRLPMRSAGPNDAEDAAKARANRASAKATSAKVSAKP